MKKRNIDPSAAPSRKLLRFEARAVLELSAWERGSGLKSMVGAGRTEKPAYAEAPVPRSMKQAAAEKVAAEHGGLRVGKGVFHTKFGEGVLLTLEGSGQDARAQVNFGRHGIKWLALSIAKLTPID